MPAEPQIHRLSSALSVWQSYDSAVKADLFATRLGTLSGTYLIDPIPLNPIPLREVLGSDPLRGILVTNNNHARASIDFSKRLNVPIYAHAEAQDALQGNEVVEINEASLAPDLKILSIEGAARGEVAVLCEAEGGTLVFGDALINMGSYGFTFLPAKYCTDAKAMRHSLRKVLDYNFERMLFAHGTPILSQARARLAELLGAR